jgi:transcription-repair coupling factor (superfamily II helicase)
MRCEFGATRPPTIGASVRRLSEELTAFAKLGFDAAIACDNEGQKRRLAEMLEDLHSTVEFIYPALHAGFVLPEAGFALLTEHESFNRHKARFRRRKFQEGLALSSYTQLKKNDFVVHVDHGIARFRGLESIMVEGRRRDCLLLLYQGDDRLFVPIEEFDRVLQVGRNSLGEDQAKGQTGASGDGRGFNQALRRTESAPRVRVQREW